MSDNPTPSANCKKPNIMSIAVSVTSRSGKALGSFQLDANATVADLKAQYAKANPKYYVERQWFTIKQAEGTPKEVKPTVLKKDDEKLSEHAKNNKLDVVFKDLGAQISWRTVFLVEYFGPLWIHPLLYFFPQWFYATAAEQYANIGAVSPKHQIQTIALVCVLFHYFKREVETIFVHRFSNATMPWFNIIKNSMHYWFLSGLMIAYFLYHPLYTPPAWLVASPIVMYALVGGFFIAELNNFQCHMILRNLRAAGTKERGIPKGNMFKFVSCANYFWELVAWLAFSVFTQCATSYFFFLVSFAQIFEWAIKKHKQYRQEFKDYPRRKALIPLLI